jgi:hypothetical protein
VRWFGTCTDIDEQKRASLTLAAARTELEEARARAEAAEARLQTAFAQAPAASR